MGNTKILHSWKNLAGFLNLVIGSLGKKVTKLNSANINPPQFSTPNYALYQYSKIAVHSPKNAIVVNCGHGLMTRILYGQSCIKNLLSL